MIKCYANKHNRKAPVSMEAEGTIEDIVDDIGNVAHTFFHHLKEGDPEAAEEFKTGLQAIFAEDGPVWMTREELLELEGVHEN